ncbi:WLM-domain-containing protein [Tothia fuscella]|uniref:WLM-domain-containing protein n=1 Tax=Tothia fuscella TaxID=1048955 RepID=A0A9P4NK13_9PEZI|nr:WLM-domain-containing protein [Tothia fuscella]
MASVEEIRPPAFQSEKNITHQGLPAMMDATSMNEEHGEQLQLTIQHHGKKIDISLPANGTLINLSEYVATELSIPPSNQKFMISPKTGLLKPPFSSENDHSLKSLSGKKIVLMGSTSAEISFLSKTIATASAPRRSGPIKTATPYRYKDWKKTQEEAQYTFHSIQPLPYLPNPERSQRFLERLASDPGIKSSMRHHKFSVGLLTEMNPAEHTTHASRTLGLNRNAGEVIELRLRTDAFDGYRDYKTIRKTLCHELAHNVWGDHDRNFWDLTKEIEKEGCARAGGGGEDEEREAEGGRCEEGWRWRCLIFDFLFV